MRVLVTGGTGIVGAHVYGSRPSDDRTAGLTELDEPSTERFDNLDGVDVDLMKRRLPEPLSRS